MFGRPPKNAAHAMSTWGNVSEPMPNAWLQLDKNDWNREVNPRPYWRNFLDLFVNMQGGGLPTGNLYPTPLPNQSDPSTFIMANARRLNPPLVTQSSGAQPQQSQTVMQNAMGSAQAAIPPAYQAGAVSAPFGFNFGSEGL